MPGHASKQPPESNAFSQSCERMFGLQTASVKALFNFKKIILLFAWHIPYVSLIVYLHLQIAL